MSRPKDVGTTFETLLLPLIARYWPGTERRALSGGNDRGDFFMPGNNIYILEAKKHRRLDLPEFWKEATAEAANAGVPHAAVAHKARGKGKAEDQWVTQTLGQWLELVHRNI